MTNAVQVRAARSPAASAHANTPRAQYGYVHGLDALRLLAVTIVVVRHYEIVMVLPGGFGVSIFFLISGFLISRLLMAEEVRQGRVAMARFYARRFVRLLPPLLLMGLVTVPLLYLCYPQEFSGLQAGLAFSYLGNLSKLGTALWGWATGLPSLEPLWSLAVEEHFYLLLAPLLILVRSARARVRLMLGVLVGSLALRFAFLALLAPDAADQVNYHLTFTRVDSMAWGVLLSLALDTGVLRAPATRLWAHVLVWGGCLAMLLSMVHWSEGYEIALKYTVQGAAIAATFLGVVFAEPMAWLRRLLEWRPFVHLGRMTYEIYLWHFPLLAILLRLLPDRTVAVPAALALTLVVAHLAYRLTTQRLAPLRRRFGGHPVS